MIKDANLDQIIERMRLSGELTHHQIAAHFRMLDKVGKTIGVSSNLRKKLCEELKTETGLCVGKNKQIKKLDPWTTYIEDLGMNRGLLWMPVYFAVLDDNLDEGEVLDLLDRQYASRDSEQKGFAWVKDPTKTIDVYPNEVERSVRYIAQRLGLKNSFAWSRKSEGIDGSYARLKDLVVL